MRAALLLLAVLLGGCVGPSGLACDGTFDARVVKVVDGDTLDVEPCGRVRLALVNTPELGKPGYAAATNFTANVCPRGSTATVDADAGQPRDPFNRIVAVVLCHGRHLNAALLDAGHASILVEYCAASEFSREAWAAPSCGTS